MSTGSIHSSASTLSGTAKPARPTVARFLLDGPVLPLVTNTIRVAEAFRAAAMSRFGRWCRQHPNEAEPFRRRDRPDQFSSATLSGKHANGEMRTDHGHAHYVPTAEGDDVRWITHMTVFAEDGFGPAEVAALTGLRDLDLSAGGGRAQSLRVQLIGLGPLGLFRQSVRLFGESRVWASVTPFVAHRHPKRRGTKRDAPHVLGSDGRLSFAEVAVRELVERRGIGALAAVEPLDFGAGGVRGVEFERGRARPGDDGRARPFGGFRLTFEFPVSGPLCLGYSSHYGLGLFAIDGTNRSESRGGE